MITEHENEPFISLACTEIRGSFANVAFLIGITKGCAERFRAGVSRLGRSRAER